MQSDLETLTFTFKKMSLKTNYLLITYKRVFYIIFTIQSS